MDGGVPQEPVVCAGFLRRLAASLLDLAILAATVTAIALATGWPTHTITSVSGPDYAGASASTKDWVNLVAGLYFVVLPAVLRRTPAKWLLGLCVVTAEGYEPCGRLRHVGRTLAYFVTVMTFFVGYLWILFDRRGQSFHDKLAGTVVVYEAAPPSSRER